MAAVASRECYIGIQNKQYVVANFLQLYCLDHFAVSSSPAQSDIHVCCEEDTCITLTNQ